MTTATVRVGPRRVAVTAGELSLVEAALRGGGSVPVPEDMRSQARVLQALSVGKVRGRRDGQPGRVLELSDDVEVLPC